MNRPLGVVLQIYALRQIACLDSEGDLLEGLFYELRDDGSGHVTLDERLRNGDGDFQSQPIDLFDKNGKRRSKSYRTYAQVQQPAGGDLSNAYPGLALSLFVRESDSLIDIGPAPRLYGPANIEEIVQLGELTSALDTLTGRSTQANKQDLAPAEHEEARGQLERLESQLACLGLYWSEGGGTAGGSEEVDPSN